MSAREEIARWLWAMDSVPGAKWDEWPDEHGDYLAKADAYVADTPWLPALLADAERVKRVRDLAGIFARAAQLTQTMTLDRHYHKARGDGLAQAVREIRRALDGDQ